MCDRNTEQAYVDICKSFDMQPLPDFQEALLRVPHIINVSSFFFPRKHFCTVLQLLRIRSDILELILDGADLLESDIRSLVIILSERPISKLSFRHVMLSPASGLLLRDLCRASSSIIDVCLDGSLLPEYLLSNIQLSVELNRLGILENKAVEIPSVRKEGPKCCRWNIQSPNANGGDIKMNYQPSCSVEEALHLVCNTSSGVFVDNEFGESTTSWQPDVRWVRLKELTATFVSSDGYCRGGVPLQSSDYIDNKNLCAALNVIQQYDYLCKGLLCREVCDVGFYVIRLFRDGDPINVIIDDRIPCVMGIHGLKPFGISSQSNDYWGTLVEKSIAKVVGGYRALEEMSFAEALTILSNGVCFEITWKDLSHLKTQGMFEYLRDLMLQKRVLASVASPESQIAYDALLSEGIVPHTSYCVRGTDICRENDARITYLVQLAAPTARMKCRRRFQSSEFYDGTMNGFPVWWMTFEDYATLFARTYLLMWPQYDYSCVRRQPAHLEVVCRAAPTMSTFATNDSVSLVNLTASRQDLILTVSQTGCGAGDNNWVALYFFKVEEGGDDNKVSARCDICPQNAILTTRRFRGSGSILIRLHPRERLQVTVASSAFSKCELKTSSCGSYKIQRLPFTSEFQTFCGRFDRPLRHEYVSKNFFSFEIFSKVSSCDLVIAVAQECSHSSPHPISLLGWEIATGHVVDSQLEAPNMVFEVQREYLAVYKLTVRARSDSHFTFTPCCKEACDDTHFSFTIFSSYPLKSTVYDVVLKCAVEV